MKQNKACQYLENSLKKVGWNKYQRLRVQQLHKTHKRLNHNDTTHPQNNPHPQSQTNHQSQQQIQSAQHIEYARVSNINQLIQNYCLQKKIQYKFRTWIKIPYSKDTLKENSILVDLVVRDLCMVVCGICNGLYLQEFGGMAVIQLRGVGIGEGQQLVEFTQKESIKQLLFPNNKWKQSIYPLQTLQIHQTPSKTHPDKKSLSISVQLDLSQNRPSLTTIAMRNINPQSHPHTHNHAHTHTHNHNQIKIHKGIPYFLNLRAANGADLPNELYVLESQADLYRMMLEADAGYRARVVGWSTLGDVKCGRIYCQSGQISMDLVEIDRLVYYQNKQESKQTEIQNKYIFIKHKNSLPYILPQKANNSLLILKSSKSQTYIDDFKKQLQIKGIKCQFIKANFKNLQQISKPIYWISHTEYRDDVQKVLSQGTKNWLQVILALFSYKHAMKIQRISEEKLNQFRNLYRSLVEQLSQKQQFVIKRLDSFNLYLNFRDHSEGFLALYLVNYLNIYKDRNVSFIEESQFKALQKQQMILKNLTTQKKQQQMHKTKKKKIKYIQKPK